MNRDINRDPDAILPDDQAEREWQAQEHALADQRAGRVADDETHLRAYRLIARVASEPPSLQLPADFAQRTARAASMQVARQTGRIDEGRFERYLLLLLIAAMGLGGGTVLLLFAPAWRPAFGATAVMLGSPWPWALAVCLGLSGLSARWHRHLPRG